MVAGLGGTFARVDFAATAARARAQALGDAGSGGSGSSNNSDSGSCRDGSSSSSSSSSAGMGRSSGFSVLRDLEVAIEMADALTALAANNKNHSRMPLEGRIHRSDSHNDSGKGVAGGWSVGSGAL
jgi:hypothetical protein